MSARDAILGKIRKNISTSGDVDRRSVVLERLNKHPVGLIPARGRRAPGARLDLFCEQADKVQAGTTRLKSIDQLPEAVSDYLRGRNLPQILRMGSDKRLHKAPWKKSAIEIKDGPSDGNDPISLSHAEAGVAETATLILTSGTDNPTTLNFLPETHLVVVNASDIEGDYEAVWAKIRKKYGKGQMPRTVNMVTGPSRSGDIEQTILLGAHGPRAVQIFIIED